VVIKKTKVRKNGFERPFSLLQIVSWVIAACIFISYTVTSACLFYQEDHFIPIIAVGVFYFSAFLAMVVTTVSVTNSDPTDPTINLEREYRQSLAKEGGPKVLFDADKFGFFCSVCDTHVLKNTKHC